VAAVLAVAGPADAATLRWKFKAGETLHYQLEQKTSTELKNAARPLNVKTTNTQTIDTIWKVESVDPDGAARITWTIERMKTRLEAPGVSFEFDTTSEKAPEGPIAEAIVPTFKLLVGAPFRFKMTSRGELREVEVPTGLVDKLKGTSPNAARAAGGMFSEEGLKNMIRESSLDLPEDDVARGKSWSRPTAMPPSPVGALVIDKTYTYEGPADGAEKLSLKVAIKLTPPTNSPVNVQLGEQQGTGTYLFDNTLGRIASSNVSERVEMVIASNDQKVEQVTETSSTVKLTGAK
jgi:hypothetical protein